MNRFGILLLLLVALVTCLASVFLGTVTIPLADMVDPSSMGWRILFDFRLPRVAFAFSVGMGLAVIGATYQTLFANPLAEPYVLGVSSSALLGVAIGQFVFGWEPAQAPVSFLGFVFGTSSSLLLAGFTSRGFRYEPSKVVLFGMAINFVLSSVVFLMVTHVYQGLGAGNLPWLFGNIPWITPAELVLPVTLSFATVGLLVFFARSLDAMALGDTVAKTLGVSASRLRTGLILATSVFLSVSVVTCGSIGFVGLAVPHAVRLLLGPRDMRAMILGSAVLGGAFLVASDLLCRVLAPPIEFPVGIITTLFGGPILLWLLWRRAA